MWDMARNVGDRYKPEERVRNMNCDLIQSYIKGYEDGVYDGMDRGGQKNDKVTDKAYMDGMSAAWKAAEKVSNMPREDRKRIFGKVFLYDIVRDRTPLTVISMLEQDEKEKEAIKNGKNYDRDFAIGNIVRHKDNRDIRGMVLNEHFTDDDGKEKFRAVGSSGGVFNLLSCEDYVWTGINVGYAKYLRRSEEESGDKSDG